MKTPWIELDELKVNFENIPALLDRYNLLPDFLKRLLETKFTSKLKPKKEEQIKFFQGFLKEKNIVGKEALNQWLLDNGLDDKRLDTMLYERLQVELFKKQKFGDKVNSVFFKQKDSLDRVMYSVLRVKTAEQAHELHTQIEEMESSFSDLVSEYSIGTEKNFNGIIGPVELGRLDPALAERLKISKNGQLWLPFEFRKNWVILRLEKHLPSKLDDKMTARIINSMYDDWINKQVLEIIDQLRYPKNRERTLIKDKNDNPDTENGSE